MAGGLAVEDADLDGIVIPAGTCLVVNTAAANRDPAPYNDPERFDITRHKSNPVMVLVMASTIRRRRRVSIGQYA
jgi:cytochrome P450